MKNIFYILTVTTFLLSTKPLFAAETDIGIQGVSNEVQTEEKKMIKPNEVLLKEMDDNEREWYEKFQEGMMFLDGWRQISKDILEEVSDNKKDELKPLLETLGVRMGTEWARDNDTRKINTDDLKQWGKRMKKAKKQGEEQIFTTVKTIYKEVEDQLLKE